MLDYTAIGQKIRAIRKVRNLSQEQLAEKVWISTTHMSHIETGATKLSLPVLVDLANVLEVGTDEILGTNVHSAKTEISDSVRAVLDSCTSQQARVIEEIVITAKRVMDEVM